MINIKGVVKRAVRETTQCHVITKLNASEANSAPAKTSADPEIFTLK